MFSQSYFTREGCRDRVHFQSLRAERLSFPWGMFISLCQEKNSGFNGPLRPPHTALYTHILFLPDPPTHSTISLRLCPSTFILGAPQWYTRSMVRFECSRCGRCCLNFGRYIIIERQLEGRRFSCHSRLSGEHFIAQLIESRGKDTSGGERTYSCPFLMKEVTTERYLCAIYPTRPGFCREFICSHMDIFNARGERIGRVGGKKSLLSKDPMLLAFWDREIVPLTKNDDPSWLSKAQNILENAGYRAVQYE